MRGKSGLLIALLTVIMPHGMLARHVAGANGSAQLYQSLKRLDVLARVLYIGAHPDDENNALLAYLANGELADVAYLSITRGEGGQNLVGDEQGVSLGILRVQESLAARGVDGASVCFTRAKDLGYSKTAEETLRIWGKDSVLADMVWIIRDFKPDVIISRFPTHVPHEHGHHTASGLLAEEAFHAAADPERFPEQLRHVNAWQAERLLWNVYDRFGVKGSEGNVVAEPGDFAIDIGRYNPYLGVSYAELGTESRILHHSQAMGVAVVRGRCLEYFRHVAGTPAMAGVLDGIDTGWGRSAAGSEVGHRLRRIISDYDFGDPSASVPALLELYGRLEDHADDPWATRKQEALKQLVIRLLGLNARITTQVSTVCPGDSLAVRLEVANPAAWPVNVERLVIPSSDLDVRIEGVVDGNATFSQGFAARINGNAPLSQPRWLRNGGTAGAYGTPATALELRGVGAFETGPMGTLQVNVLGRPLAIELPIVQVSVDPKIGERRHPLAIVPAVSVNLDRPVYVFAGPEPREVRITVRASRAVEPGFVELDAGEAWTVSPQRAVFPDLREGQRHEVVFRVDPPQNESETTLSAAVVIGADRYGLGRLLIDYPHIQRQYQFPEARSKAVRVAIAAKGGRIGYVCGAKDRLPESLVEMGYDVVELDHETLGWTDLDSFKAIVLGIRAYNVHTGLARFHGRLLEYAERGGTVVHLYNTNFDLKDGVAGILPVHPSSNRVTDEDAPVGFLEPDHRVLHVPNRIAGSDFEGWVYDRGMYIPDRWDSRFQAILGMRDPGEAVLAGGLLIGRIGKGYAVYTALSWFRQLPAAVPGAYRLFENILELNSEVEENYN